LGKFGGRRRQGRNFEREREGGGNSRKNIVLGNFYMGTVVAGNFGLRGQETARILGAREPKRLFLAGWEVNIQFGKFGAVGQDQEQTGKGINQPTCRSRYVFYKLVCYYYVVVIMLSIY
jgi:hypothetical protein